MLELSSNRRLTLVGAGPGDSELITLKGIRALSDAGAVLYDALVNRDLLEYAPEEAPRIFVGKKAGKHLFTQSEINDLILEFANKYGHVVRLKGGDPFIFGRGSEEVRYARMYNIAVRIIPGVSSCTALPALAQIPLTCRGVNESFWVVTGTTKDDCVSNDIRFAAKSSATVVVLMGLNKLRDILEIFSLEGKEDLPVMIIQNGSLPNEKKVFGKVKTIDRMVREEGIGTPALIVIGNTIDMFAIELMAEPRVNQMV